MRRDYFTLVLMVRHAESQLRPQFIRQRPQGVLSRHEEVLGIVLGQLAIGGSEVVLPSLTDVGKCSGVGAG